jgi:hypothetical protein
MSTNMSMEDRFAGMEAKTRIEFLQRFAGIYHRASNNPSEESHARDIHHQQRKVPEPLEPRDQVLHYAPPKQRARAGCNKRSALHRMF